MDGEKMIRVSDFLMALQKAKKEITPRPGENRQAAIRDKVLDELKIKR